jgi:circadian clock protein KaiB
LACARHVRRPGGALAIVVGPDSQPRGRFDLTRTREVLNVCESLEEAVAVVEAGDAPGDAAAPVVLTLYVNADHEHGARALVALDDLRAGHLPPGAEVHIVDLHQHPEFAEQERLLATPALVRQAPLPVRRVVGDLTNTRQVLHALGLPVTQQ